MIGQLKNVPQRYLDLIAAGYAEDDIPEWVARPDTPTLTLNPQTPQNTPPRGRYFLRYPGVRVGVRVRVPRFRYPHFPRSR